MDNKTRNILNDVNSALSRTRGIYFAFARKIGLNYNELLILYLLYETTACTQKQICEDYALPKQTVNNIITELLKKGYITATPDENDKRGKVLQLTDTGKRYSEQYLIPLLEIEQTVVSKMGAEKLQDFIDAANLYGTILQIIIYWYVLNLQT